MPEDPSLTPKSHVVRKNWLPKLVLTVPAQSKDEVTWGEFWVPMRKRKETRPESVTSVSLKTQNCSKTCFHVQARCGQEWVYTDYWLQLATVLRSYACVGKHVSAMCCLNFWFCTAWSHESFTHVISLNCQSINCLMLGIKLATEYNFNLPRF